MSKASKIIIVCEDKLQEVFICHFLKKWGVKQRVIDVVQYSEGKGSGEKFVRDRYPKELRAFRSRSASTVLIVMLDADTGTVQNRHNQLDDEAKSQKLPSREQREAVAHIIPRRNIETWLAHLDGENVNENDDYKGNGKFKNCESKAHPLIEKLVETCRNSEPLSNDAPDSLTLACQNEFLRIKPYLLA